MIPVALVVLPGFLGCASYTAPHAQPQVRPKTIVAACADANLAFGRLRWTSWTARRATASGAASVNDCTPNCAAGHFHRYPVKVTLSAPRSCHGRRELTRLAWRFEPKAPPGQPLAGAESFRCA